MVGTSQTTRTGGTVGSLTSHAMGGTMQSFISPTQTGGKMCSLTPHLTAETALSSLRKVIITESARNKLSSSHHALNSLLFAPDGYPTATEDPAEIKETARIGAVGGGGARSGRERRDWVPRTLPFGKTLLSHPDWWYNWLTHVSLNGPDWWTVQPVTVYILCTHISDVGSAMRFSHSLQYQWSQRSHPIQNSVEDEA